MPSIYSVLKKSVPFCPKHQGIQSLFYNVEELTFLCVNCVEQQEITVIEQQEEMNCKNIIGSMTNNKKQIFSLQQIIQNPVLLMLRQKPLSIHPSSFEPRNYHICQYRKILADIDHFIKTKKQTQQFTQQFFQKLRQQVNARIDDILTVLEGNERTIYDLQQKTFQLKGIKKAYNNQFLQTLQTSFINNTEAQLKELLKKYALENQNPFRKIDEIVNEITLKLGGFVEVNWQHVMGVERKLLDGYIWKREMVFLFGGSQGEKGVENNKSERSWYSLQQGNMILPYSAPCRLKMNYPSKQSERSHSGQQDLYIKCTRQSIELLTKEQQWIVSEKQSYIFDNSNSQDSLSLTYSINNNKKDSLWSKGQYHEESEGFAVIDTYSNSQDKFGHSINANTVMPIDFLYELPQHLLLTVSYQGLTFYSYQLSKLQKLASIPSIKGTSQVLIFEHFCLILTTSNNLYQINYHQLNRTLHLGVGKLKENQIIQSMCYLYEDGRKLQNGVLLTVRNKDKKKQQGKRQLRVSLDSCEEID